ncbi:MAG: glycosyltransferase family 9 protein [wastewater metagenome]|nr:glycosyltransferase family 9 protein [Candidatus Loosdrechtia aerotolerans]
MNRFGNSYPKTIAVFRALQLGDLLCTVPTFRALRKAFPRSKITLIGLPWAKAFTERFHNYLDDFIAFPGYPGLRESTPQLKSIPIFLKSVQEKKFHAAIQLHGSGSLTNPIVHLFGAQVTAGFFLPHEYCPDPYRFMPYPRSEHEIWRHLRLMEFLGISLQSDTLEFPIFQKDKRDFSAIKEMRYIQKGEYICIHPGAQLNTRRWLIERFATVADTLADTGLKIILTGSENEIRLTEGVKTTMRTPAINLAGRTSLGTLAILLKNARLLICNDTGVSHIGAALGVPSIVIATGSDPSRWAPLDRKRHRVVHYPISCRPCSYLVCPIGHPCAAGVSTKTVISQAKKLLQKDLHAKKI